MRKKASSPRLFKCLNRFQYPDAHTYEQVIEVNRTQGNCGQDQPRTGKGGGEEGIGLPADRATGSGRSTHRPAAAQGRAVTADEVWCSVEWSAALLTSGSDCAVIVWRREFSSISRARWHCGITPATWKPITLWLCCFNFTNDVKSKKCISRIERLGF